jgi:hypothetical protein
VPAAFSIFRLPETDVTGRQQEILLNTAYMIDASPEKDTHGRDITEVTLDRRGGAIGLWIAMPYEEFSALVMGDRCPT